MEKTVIKSRMTARTAGFFIIAGALTLLFEAARIFYGTATLALSDRRIDKQSIWLAVGTWILLFTGRYISLSLYAKLEKRFVLISLAGLFCYTIGSIMIALDYWGLIYIVPLGLLITSIGLVIEGIWILRTTSMKTWLNLAPALTGLYPLLLMFPTVVIYGHPNYLTNYLWGLAWLLLGFYTLRVGGLIGLSRHA